MDYLLLFQGFADNLQLEKGKPRESVGRKATGLNPLKENMVAGLPSEGSISCAEFRAAH